MNLPEGLVLSETARRATGYGKDRWRELLRSREIPSTKIGRSVYVRESDVSAYIERQFVA
ncbi:helix-turn-helix domain-containing protein [Gordonia sputi]|uniref:helix-turn-helix domain-containing protein n=1 Tax=Gordonia TaxID=2053 RepID=UPI0007EB1BD5|nr:helix-turn-helix domain-containing protein [Gordonia sputi]MCM3897107.1 helix-turn-helix domain-containing protein [Gordonia sputi]OBA64286.1 hypothetical protein A5777_22180 [Gordonia sp. 852002-10350_SCH5691597]